MLREGSTGPYGTTWREIFTSARDLEEMTFVLWLVCVAVEAGMEIIRKGRFLFRLPCRGCTRYAH
jgi:hypothetical protein